ncbi:glucans biosynthesis protein [Modicisalibacter muralis]|uniref:Glucans biosynthesis protein G n=1 Tax=Modicisalibacter muralis TaxID=119000 RepID=A0A1G9GIC3_9GAMM|nr:glucan biosynthesis protein G [Halomonas muralis]SDL00431.1 glucans biosynthesis protein [Halomonas muralis]
MNHSTLQGSATTTSRRFASPLAVVAGLWMAIMAPSCLAFGFEDVAAKAKKLVEQEYQAPETNTTPTLRELEYEQYAQIQYRMDQAIWREEGLPFQLSFFHEGMHYVSAVEMNIIDDNGVHEIPFDANDFHYGDVKLSEKDLEGLGFAGFRIHYPINTPNVFDEIMVFQGASYFRVVGKNQIYGLSGRGLAIDTETPSNKPGVPSGEEFPAFREFWVVKPEPDSQSLTLFALLDSPSATGAYRFVLRPGDDSVLDVKSRIFLRKPIKKLGIAPLTSMFLFGPSQPTSTLNYRPAIHDSNGLLLHTGKAGWIWRPLVNPTQVEVSNQHVEELKGFGLLQRSHAFHDYEDLVDRYDLRPSAWIEPQGDWGPGSVELVEIPTQNETNDNIVAFWKPDEMPALGEPIDFNYRIYWTMNESKHHDPALSWADSTMRSRGEVRQNDLIRKPDGSLAFVIDFKGPALESLAADIRPTAVIDVGDNGKLVESRVIRNVAEGGWRVILRVKRDDETKPLEIRAHLEESTRHLSETWFYRMPVAG